MESTPEYVQATVIDEDAPTVSPTAHANASGAPHERITVKRAILVGLGFLSLGIGVVGIFVPLLPTTEFVMLAAFLFSLSSTRFHTWLLNTKVYNTYVRPFKEKGGLPARAKATMLATSLVVLGISAFFVRLWYVWVILAICALVIVYVILIRTPTRKED